MNLVPGNLKMAIESSRHVTNHSFNPPGGLELLRADDFSVGETSDLSASNSGRVMLSTGFLAIP
jgi:hypothetical protein